MELSFKGKWRSYQKRILDALDFHLTDEKLHVIAAPGAGKTTLGIEVIARLRKPTLILCPTNTIKNQWVDRICKSFLDECDYNQVSTDIKNPKFLTVITYQALLAAFTGANTESETESETFEEDEENDSIVSSKRFNPKKSEEIINILKKSKISVLCFDEAHHLRKEWWKALSYLVDELQPKQTVALTATPPYDVNYGEWQRYETLCGEIDEVISIPELVQNGDLCPHQDFIHFSLLRDNEKEFVKKHTANIRQFIEKIVSDKKLLIYMRSMSFLTPTDNDVEKIFENPEFYVSIASLLNATSIEIPKDFLNLFDATIYDLPKFNTQQAKSFLNGFLITNTAEFSGLEEKISEYLNLAKKLGLVQNKKIVLDDSTKIQKQVSGSMGKLDSIVQILELENSCLKNDLRMVILADYIKEKDTDNSHLGVVPIWRTVKNKFPRISIGVLCGSLIVMPWETQRYFIKLLEDNGISMDCVTITPFKEDEKFIKITPKESAKNHIVSIITEMFNQGYVTVLIGTQALLGEGWDAPCINSLILSSTVSSYMLSNQMRGRAIRIDKNNPNKISNIWHLASVKLPRNDDIISNKIFKSVVTSDDLDTINAGFYDLNQLKRRFEGFEAPSYYHEHEIVSGIGRVFAATNYNLLNTMGERVFLDLNKETMKLASNRPQTKQWWDNSLNLGYNQGFRKCSMNTGIDTPRMTAKSLCYTGYKQILYSILATFAFLFMTISTQAPFEILYIAWFIGLIISLLYVGANYLRTGTIEAVMKQVAIVHLETLSGLNYIKTSLKKTGILLDKTQSGIYVSCNNLPADENNMLVNAMREFLDPIENPRYVLIKREKFAKFMNQVDYYAIPNIISSRKRDVELFKHFWEKYIGPCEIVYTRNLEGRKLLLKARKMAFSAKKREETQKVSRWS